MTEQQILEVIPVEQLVSRAQRIKAQGMRLAQIGAARLPDHLEVNYSFAYQEKFLTLRLQLTDPNTRVPSISGVYWCAALYENELHDLFKLQVDGMVVDFDGKFYQTAVPYPFGSRKAPAAPRPAAAKPPKNPDPAANGGAQVTTRVE